MKVHLGTREFWFEDAGQDAVEYALLIAFVVVASAAGITPALTALSNLWTAINTLLSSTG